MLVRLSHAAVLLLAPVALLPLSYGFTTPGALGARNARPVLSCDVRDLRAAAPAVWQGAARLQTRMSADAGPGWADDDSSVKWEEPPLETAARTATAEEIKRQFLVAAAGANRGLAAAGDQRRELLELVGELEALQADGAAPNDDPALLGEWRLLFTSAFDVLSLGAIPLVSVGQIFQNVYDREGAGLLTVENVVELSPAADPILRAVAGGSTLQLVVTAQGVKQGADQIGISFERSKLQPLSLLGQDVATLLPPLEIPLQVSGAVRSATDAMSQGSIKTTYLDQDVRIARGAAPGGLYTSTDSNVFVLWRA